jgi:hypothetical protein
MLADIIATQYKVIGDNKDTAEMPMPCIAYGQTLQISTQASSSTVCTAWTVNR